MRKNRRLVLSKKNKVLLGVFLAFVALLGFGVYCPFLPSRAAMLAALVLAGGSLVWLKNYLKDVWPLVDGFLGEFKYKRALKVTVGLIAFVLLYETYAKPIPYLANFVIGKPGQTVTTVTHRDTSVSSTHTRYYLELDIPQWFLVARGLTVSKKGYNRLEAGDAIRLAGRKSFLGLTVSGVQKVSK